MVTATRQRWMSEVQRARMEGFIKSEAEADYETMQAFVKRGEYRIETATSMRLDMELRAFDKTLPLIFNRKWHVLRAIPSSPGF